MAAPIEFYFDLSSPYGYVASVKIDAIAAKHGREVLWRPYLLGVPFKKAGIQPLVNVPMKAEYSLRDFARNARFHGVEYKHPTRFPTGTTAAVRAFYWIESTETLAGAWTSETIGGNVTIVGNSITYTFPATTRRFARLKVVGP